MERSADMDRTSSPYNQNNWEDGKQYEHSPFSYFLRKEDGNYMYNFKLENENKPLTEKIGRIFHLEKEKIITSIPAEITDINVIIKKITDHLRRKVKNCLLLKRGEIKKLNSIFRYFAYKIIGLGKLYPMLIDKRVDEIYIDSPGEPIYIDHHIGRIETSLQLSRNEIHRLVTIARVNGDAIITPESPSSKIDLVTKDFRVRISIDSPPLVTSTSFDIRKLQTTAPDPSLFITSNKKATLFALITFAAAIRSNIMVVGEPASGKTTLVSALISLMPKFWRILSIEGVRELPQFPNKRHLRVNVNPLEEGIKKRSKKREINKSLHKAVDYVFIGEVQCKKDNQAVFNTIAAGIPVAATLHARNLRELINRWTCVFEINEERVKNVDLIVLMKRKITPTSIFRKISRVYLTMDETIPQTIFEKLNQDSSDKGGEVKNFSALNFYEINGCYTKSWFRTVLKSICLKASTVTFTPEKLQRILKLIYKVRRLLIQSNEKISSSITEITETIYEIV